MIRACLLILLMFSPLAFADKGAWSGESFGGTLTVGKQVLKSRPVSPVSPLPAGSKTNRIAWKIVTSRPTPAGFSAKVCTANYCLSLPAMTGECPLPAAFRASGPYRFEYYVAARGVIYPPLTVLSNQLTIGYMTTP